MAAWLGGDAVNVYTASFQTGPKSALASVVLYVCGLGYSSVRFNGQDLNVLTTAPWTNNAIVNGFSSLDLTPWLADGGDANHVIVSLGYGWRDTNVFAVRDDDSKDRVGAVARMLRAKVLATFNNGSTSVLTYTGDGTWQAAAGPSTADSVYNGESYDARIAAELFDSDGRAAARSSSRWVPAPRVDGPAGRMVPWSVPPVEVLATVPPVAMTTPKPGLYLFDFGVRASGVTRLKLVACPSGATLRIRHAEIMQHAGLPDLQTVDPTMIYTGNLRSAEATDVYTCAGGSATWAPALTYHGFRFAEVNVSGAAGVILTMDSVEMVHFASAVPQRTQVNFTSATLNKLQAMAVGAQRSNLMTIPTDCDQRDERLGWLGDANLSGESMALNFDMSAFFSWFLLYGIATEVGHGVNGSLPDVVPFLRYGGRPADVSWSAAMITLLHVGWKQYGDLRTYRSMGDEVAAQLANVAVQAAAGLGKMHTPYGDWCPPPEKMGGGQGPKPSEPLTSAFSYVTMVKHASELADASGDAAAAKTLDDLAAKLTDEYNAAFYHKESGSYDTGTQTALALGLAMGAAPDTKATQKLLLDKLDAKGTHFDTGIIGLSQLFPVLGAAGAHDTALAVLAQTDYPSLGFEFANELEKTTTNLWELPDAPAEGTGMNSRNHHMYSSYSSYLVQSVAGVRQVAGSHGYKHLELRAASARALHGASATLDLPSGELSFRWSRSGGRQHDKVSEGDSAEFDCGPRGGVIEAVEFASFGTPAVRRRSAVGGISEMSEIPPLEAHPLCHAPRSAEVLTSACVGRQRCSMLATREALGLDASKFGTELLANCSAAAKRRGGRLAEWSDPLRFWATVRCSVAAESLDVSTTIPLGVSATLVLPLRDMRNPVVVDATSQPTIFPQRTFPSFVNDALVLLDDQELGRALALELKSGEYTLVLQDGAVEV